jgi:L-lactate dehydrogenase complex protein LldG
VVVLSIHRIHATLADFLAAHVDDVPRTAHLAIVTGPSRTADIELTLTRGVHGPKDVHIVIVS